MFVCIWLPILAPLSLLRTCASLSRSISSYLLDVLLSQSAFSSSPRSCLRYKTGPLRFWSNVRESPLSCVYLRASCLSHPFFIWGSPVSMVYLTSLTSRYPALPFPGEMSVARNPSSLAFLSLSTSDHASQGMSVARKHGLLGFFAFKMPVFPLFFTVFLVAFYL